MTYAVLCRICEKEARKLLKFNNVSLMTDLTVSVWNKTYEAGYTIFDAYRDGGEEAIKEMLEDSSYSYVIKRDGTILVSGEEEFLGMNANDIEGISDILKHFSEGEEQDGAYVTPQPVKTIDGKLDVYYMGMTTFDTPDVIFLLAYDEEYFDMVGSSAAEVLTLNRIIGTTGYSVMVDEEGTIIGCTDDEKSQTAFPYPELMEDYVSESAERDFIYSIEADTSNGVVDYEYKMMLGHHTFWGEKCVFCMGKKGGVYILSVYPESEAMIHARRTILWLITIEVIVFAVLFVALHLMIRRRVIRNLDLVNASLARITGGNLEERVHVGDTREFHALSKDINATVERLNGYIAEAAARIDADLAVAEAIQNSALPSVFPPFPDRKEFQLFASMNAAKTVGGDFYDFFMLSNHTLGFLIADVSGKSIPGAMFMMKAKTVIKSLAESGLSPAETFTRANEMLCEGNDAEMFVTAWMGYLDYSTGLVRVANAGHNAPVLIHKGSAEFAVLKPGLVLAGMEGIRYREHTLQLEKGDILFLYTDGVTEATNVNEELYGDKRLQSLLSEVGEEVVSKEVVSEEDDAVSGASSEDASVTETTTEEDSVAEVSAEEDEKEFAAKEGEAPADYVVEEVCDRVLADVRKFTAGAEQSDDITMLCIQYLG